MNYKLKKLAIILTCGACLLTNLLTFQTAKAAIIKGDVDGDGKITSSDATAVLIDYATRLNGGSGNLDINIADITNDGRIDSADATMMLIQYANDLQAIGKNIDDYSPLKEIWYKDYWIGDERQNISYDMLRETAKNNIFNSTKSNSGRTSYDFYNSQKKGGKIEKKNISNNDINIIKNFANTHFGANWTKPEKVLYTLYWIHCNVDYATDYNRVYKYKGYADCIFNGKVGQCLQYNGALAEMMSYLGYDVNLVQGYTVGGKYQRFWVEIKINGKYYVMETGNESSQGTWMNFCEPYEDALGGYTKNYDYAD